MDIREKLYLSTIGEDVCELAERHSLGLEMAEFCTAVNLDEGRNKWLPICRERMKKSNRFLLHAPFNELYPFAVDPLARNVARTRFEQAFCTAEELSINRMVVHTGHVPTLYFDSFFAEHSIEFWKSFLKDKPQDFELLIENVIDTSPYPIEEIMRGVDDRRCRICLDVGHAFVASKNSIDEWLDVLMPWLGHVHVHDNNGNFDSHLPLGKGSINWEKVISRISEEATDATFTVENMQCAETVSWLTEHDFIRE